MNPAVLFILGAVIALSGCDVSKIVPTELAEVSELASKAETEIKDKTNITATIGVEIENGNLNYVSVTIQNQAHIKQSAMELKDTIYPIVRKRFGKDPDVFRLVHEYHLKK